MKKLQPRRVCTDPCILGSKTLYLVSSSSSPLGLALDSCKQSRNDGTIDQGPVFRREGIVFLRGLVFQHYTTTHDADQWQTGCSDSRAQRGVHAGEEDVFRRSTERKAQFLARFEQNSIEPFMIAIDSCHGSNISSVPSYTCSRIYWIIRLRSRMVPFCWQKPRIQLPTGPRLLSLFTHI